MSDKSIYFSVDIPPISINRCWQGRRFKTKEYKEWRESAYYTILPKDNYHWHPEALFTVKYTFHVKNFFKIDVDNMIKPIQDSLVEIGILPDDRLVTKIEAEKIKCEKGEKESIDIFIEVNGYHKSVK